MPLYRFYCYSCGHVWEESRTVAERLEPTKKPCPECGAVHGKKTKDGDPSGVDILICATAIGDSVRLGITKPRGDFREILQQIKKNNPKSTLDI